MTRGGLISYLWVTRKGGGLNPFIFGGWANIIFAKKNIVTDKSESFIVISTDTSRFIRPCKSRTDARFGNTQFVTQNTHVTRHPGVWSKKQKEIFRNFFLVMRSQICEKGPKLYVKLLRKKS